MIAAGAAVKRASPLLIKAARESPAVFCQYVLRDEASGRPVRLADMHVEWHNLLSKNQRCVIWSATDQGKAVPLTTPIPTPGGWRTMGDLKVGDAVFDSFGRPCRVTFATPAQHARDVFRVRFDDGDEVLADADHQWIAWRADDLADHKAPRTVTTAAMLGAGIKVGARYEWKIPLAGAAQYRDRRLLVHPYVLGAWLGDGITTGARITFHENDRAIFDRCVELTGNRPGVEHRDRRRPHVITASIRRGDSDSPTGHRGDRSSLRWQLSKLGVLGCKRIPAAYLTSSEAQRRELLAGLLDTDGSVGEDGRRVEFCSMDADLAGDVAELVRSLGYKAALRSSDAKISGRVVGKRYRLTFTARDVVFRLARKAERQRPGPPDRLRGCHRSVVAIEPVDSVPVKCIAVDSPDRSYLMGRSYTVTHNTSQISVGRMLWEIGRNPNIRILIVTEAQSLGRKIIESIKGYIATSAELAQVFPNLRRGKLWTQSAITVARTSTGKDPTIQAVGYRGRILGARVDLILIDDYLSADNTYNDAQRTATHRWLKSTIEGRKAPTCRLWFIGNAWHKRDSMHLYSKEQGTASKRYPVLDEHGRPRWPARWTRKRYEEERLNRGPVEAARSLDCDAADDNTQWFPIRDVWPALRLGDRLPIVWELEAVPPGWATITAIDLGVKTHEAADDTAIITISVDPKGRRRILYVESGKWRGSEIIRRALEHHDRYHSILWVETNGAQEYLADGIRERRRTCPVKSFITTGRNRMHPTFGIQTLAAEMSQGAWQIPNTHGSEVVDPDGSSLTAVRMHHEIRKLMEQILAFSPDQHTGDLLQALWIASVGARALGIKVEVGAKPRGT